MAILSILKEKRYPFTLAFFALLMFVTFILISNSQSPIPITSDLSQPGPLSPDLVSDVSTLSGISSNTSSAITNNTSVDADKGNVGSGYDGGGGGDDDGVVAAVSSLSGSSNTSSAITNDTSVDADKGNVGGGYDGGGGGGDDDGVVGVEWELCDGGALAGDYIPCLDNWKAIKALPSRKRMEHRERHCPDPAPRCLVPMPGGYRAPVPWPKSRDMIWYSNVPHPKLVEYKKDQRWVVKSDDYFVFPGGGTQFKNGVNYYIESISKILPVIEWGKKTRVVLDVGCGVASFGGALLDKDVITMSFAPKDEHEAQIQFALERGIPATLSVIGTQKLTFPDNSYDLIHCARCRVHWDGDGGKPLMELNRILRPGGYFVWSATPVYRKDEKHINLWKSMVTLSESICWSIAAKTYMESSQVGLVIFQKPMSSSCYQNRKENIPPLCDHSSRPNNSWYAPLDSCLVPILDDSLKWPSPWPQRLSDKPPSLSVEQDADETFRADTRHWSALVSEVYLGGLDLNWSNVRNVMDMNAGYGGFAAALISQPLWVMNVVPIHEPDTLSVIFDRGLIGVYHDWCESFNTYPRTYDLLHSSFLFGNLTKRCDIIEVAAEMDRILRPGGYLVVQDTMEILTKITPILKSLRWSISVHQDQFLVGKKDFWRPDTKTRI